jgi:hypothetical protein
MKTKTIFSSVLLFFAIFLCACEGATMKDDGSFNVNKDPLYSSCYNCITDDIHGETADEFADVVARYNTTHASNYNDYATGRLSGTSLGSPSKIELPTFKDAQSCWYSIDTLKKFICLMEKYAAKSNIKTADLGVRFYYANYPDNYTRDITLSKHHTLFLTATTNMGGNNIDFDPRISAEKGQTGKEITTIASLISLQNPTFRTRELFVLAGKASMNQGDLCPPGTGCTNTLSAVDNAYPQPHP